MAQAVARRGGGGRWLVLSGMAGCAWRGRAASEGAGFPFPSSRGARPPSRPMGALGSVTCSPPPPPKRRREPRAPPGQQPPQPPPLGLGAGDAGGRGGGGGGVGARTGRGQSAAARVGCGDGAGACAAGRPGRAAVEAVGGAGRAPHCLLCVLSSGDGRGPGGKQGAITASGVPALWLPLPRGDPTALSKGSGRLPHLCGYGVLARARGGRGHCGGTQRRGVRVGWRAPGSGQVLEDTGGRGRGGEGFGGHVAGVGRFGGE